MPYLSNTWIFVVLRDEIGAIGGVISRATEGFAFREVTERSFYIIVDGRRTLSCIFGEI